jgi:hypothetical protein
VRTPLTMPDAVSESCKMFPELGSESSVVQTTSSWPVGCSGNVVPGVPASARAGPAPRASAPATTAVPTPRRILSLMTFPFVFDDLSIVVVVTSRACGTPCAATMGPGCALSSPRGKCELALGQRQGVGVSRGLAVWAGRGCRVEGEKATCGGWQRAPCGFMLLVCVWASGTRGEPVGMRSSAYASGAGDVTRVRGRGGRRWLPLRCGSRCWRVGVGGWCRRCRCRTCRTGWRNVA